MELNRLKLSSYIKSKRAVEYDTILKHMNPKNEFQGNTFNRHKITYKEMRSLVHLLNNGKGWEDLYDIFNICFKVTKQQFHSCYIDDFFAAKNFIIKYVKDGLEREAKLLNSISVNSELWKTAGGDKLNVFSNLMPLKQLGEIYSVYPFDLENKPYSEIITLLVAHKQTSEVQEAYSNLRHRLKV